MKNIIVFVLNIFCIVITELHKGRMFKYEKVLLVLVCDMHFYASCFLYSLNNNEGMSNSNGNGDGTHFWRF